MGPVWCRLVNHLLIIALRALSLPLPLSFSPCFLFPLHLLLYLSGHAPSLAERESARRPASQHFIIRATVSIVTTFFFLEKMKVCLFLCVRKGTEIVVWDFLKSSCRCDSPSEKGEGFIMFRVSGEVEYNLSVIPALCGQLRPRTCHPSATSTGWARGVEDNCMVRHEVSQHCCMSEIELSWRLALPPQCRDVCCYSSCGLHISILLFFSSSHIVAMLMCKTYTTDLKPGPPIIGLFHSEHSRTWGNNQNVQRKERCLVML